MARSKSNYGVRNKKENTKNSSLKKKYLKTFSNQTLKIK